MKTVVVFSVCAFLSAARVTAETSISVDSIRQNRPWSAEITVGFTLSGAGSSGVDVKVEAFSGDTPLGEVDVSGDRLALVVDGSYKVTFDPSEIPCEGNPVIDDFSVKLTPVASHPSWNVPLYRIYDLTKEDASPEILTPAQIVSGAYGTWHWSCDAPVLAPGDQVPYTNLVWTGVTQAVYKTSKLVMRYMPAEGDTVNICCYKNYSYEMPDDYYVAVYETTRGQWKNVTGSESPTGQSGSYIAARPVESVTYADVRGHSADNYWPQAPAAESFIGKLRAKTSNTPFDLPAAYQLTYAAQSGTKFGVAALNFDEATWPDNVPTVDEVDGVTVTNSAPGRLAIATASVGNFAPSVRGIYDIIGNVKEMCVDWNFETQGAQRTLGAFANVDPDDPSKPRTEGGSTTERHYTGCAYNVRNLQETALNYARGAVDPEVGSADIGFRLVLAASGDEEGETAELEGARPGVSDQVEIFARPDETAFWRTATNSTFDVSWVFPPSAGKATLSVVGKGAERTYPDLTATAQTVELPVVSSAADEDVYELTLTFDDGTVERCTMAVVRGAKEGAAATVDYASTRKPSWHTVGSRAVFPVPFGAVSITVDGETAELDGSYGWFSYVYPVSAESSSVSLSTGGAEYLNDLHPYKGMCILVR